MLHVILADGFEEIEALTTIDILRRCDIQVNTVSITGKRAVVGAHGITVMADCLFRQSAITASECIILPGGMPGVENLYACDGLKKVLRTHMSHGKLTAAICAAPMVLGKRGYLQGKEAICFPGFEDDLEGAILSTAKVACDGRYITAAGMGVALDFGLAIVAYFCGEEKGNMEFYYVSDLDKLEAGAYGIREPKKDSIPVTDLTDALILVPALAFDREGHRIGYGGGYYDRYLRRCGARAIGVIYEELLADSLPHEPHDISVDAIVTEGRILSVKK